jgi:protein tyrosine/serine phosphatase
MPEMDSGQSVKSAQTRKKLVGLVAILLVISGSILGAKAIKNHIIPKHFGVVKEGCVYRSGQLSGTLVKRVLARYKIKVIVDLTFANPKDADQQAESKAAEELGIELVRLPLGGDGTGDINRYAYAITEIVDGQRKGKPVLVHCAAGAQRTGGVIAAYRLLVEKKDPAFVLEELERYGWKPEHDKRLLIYLNGNMGELASLLKKMNVIDDVPDPLPQLNPK